MVCCFVLAQKLFSKSLATPHISELRSAFSVCSTPGTRSFRFILMFTALFPPAGSRSITPAGFDLTRASFSPFPCSTRCFAASSSTLSSWPFSSATAVSQKLGGLLETTLRGPRVCAPVSRPLHPPRRHLQPSTGLVGRRPSHLSRAGLG